MAKFNSALLEQDKFDLTPMIDVVFLLLIYFMVTAALIKEEADISIQLPTPSDNTSSDELPEEAFIFIEPSGQVLFNGSPIDQLDSRAMPGLAQSLERLRLNADASGRKMFVSIQADPASLHQRSIDVLNACASAKVRFVSFGAEQ